jgi:hypothetical protein
MSEWDHETPEQICILDVDGTTCESLKTRIALHALRKLGLRRGTKVLYRYATKTTSEIDIENLTPSIKYAIKNHLKFTKGTVESLKEIYSKSYSGKSIIYLSNLGNDFDIRADIISQLTADISPNISPSDIILLPPNSSKLEALKLICKENPSADISFLDDSPEHVRAGMEAGIEKSYLKTRNPIKIFWQSTLGLSNVCGSVAEFLKQR